MTEKILISGGWEKGIEEVRSGLKKEGYKVVSPDFADLLPAFKKEKPEMVALCVSAESLAGAAKKIFEIKQVNDAVPIVVFSDNEGWEGVVALMKAGVADYAKLPLGKEKLKKLVTHHLKLYELARKVYFGESDQDSVVPFHGMVGRSERMQENFRMIQAVAKSNATVLITGESGTGKELVAKAIHRLSDRQNGRFVDLNCGAIPRELLENELFGHEKGAFTGAHKRYNGSFEAAHRGTLFLDEISEMDPMLQVKLLRVLQERSFSRIGGTEKIDVDVRIIAATNRNLADSIEKGQFREDLFYRLNVVNVPIPSLRERREDIPLLAAHFLEFYSAKNSRIFLDFSNDALEALINYEWPGNVRELENTIERIVVLHNDSQVKLKYLPRPIQKVNRQIGFSELSTISGTENRVVPLDDLERQAIEMAMMKFQGNIAIVARKLKIGQATLYRKVKKYGLEQ
ncbi:MAG: sigma-54 dependent transcriptional regulator [Deltaproteobacteria bacterium]|nr:sigma-54 dependent transcriptional regulator [Deltaproteobacteria bacterium]